MATHTLEPVLGQVVDAFSCEVPPAVTIHSGDRVTARTLDAGGHLEPWRTLGQERKRLFASERGHCLSGPIVVEEARPGQFLAVQVESLRPADWGYTIAGIRDDALHRHLGTVEG